MQRGCGLPVSARGQVLWVAMLLLPGASGCSSRSVGFVGDAGIQDPDGTPPEDAVVRPDAGQVGLWGTLVYRDERREMGGPGMSALFTAAFFETDYPLPEAVPSGYVETRVTHDNVECDIYFTSPDWGGVPSPVPPEPERVDAGEIRLESAFDALDDFAVSWQGAGYSTDERPSAAEALPGWVVPEEMEVLAVFLGSPRLPAGNRRASLAPTPKLVEPVGEGVVHPNANGLFRVAWEADAEVPLQVRFDMNMDWDNATFLCHPPTGHSELLLPPDWLNEYSWGYAELRVITWQEERFQTGGADLRLRFRRTTYRSVQFEIDW